MKISVYTDAGQFPLLGNVIACAFCAFLPEGKVISRVKVLKNCHNADDAEIRAILFAIETLRKKYGDQGHELLIQSDSGTAKGIFQLSRNPNLTFLKKSRERKFTKKLLSVFKENQQFDFKFNHTCGKQKKFTGITIPHHHIIHHVQRLHHKKIHARSIATVEG